LLIAPSIIEDNEGIFIDVIINTYNGVKIFDFNCKCENYQKIEKLQKLISAIQGNLNNTCNPGTCLYTAYRLLLERKENKKIFLITDGFVDNKYEIYLTFDLIKNFRKNEIEMYAIGVGLYPYGLNKIYHKCCYSLSIKNLCVCLSICFENTQYSTSDKITPNLLVINRESDYEKLKIIFQNNNVIDKKLIESLELPEVDILDCLLFYEETYFKKGKVHKEIRNFESDPYIDYIFEKKFENYIFRVLIVILYLSKENNENNDDKDINEETFIKNTGAVLEKKGLKYTLVYNYRDAINELIEEENGHCKYIETWIFCSDGSGNKREGKQIYYSENNKRGGNEENISEQDNEKDLISFLETVSEFNRKGGSLAIFCDNEPFVLEANLLLTEYLEFNDMKSANFIMKGNYLGKKDVVDKTILKDFDDKKNDFFSPLTTLDPIGNTSITRKSLRIGLIKFNEGITLSYAEKIDKNKNYEPFTPFAFTEVGKPFILFYDPNINTDPRGPIVVHGGYTSAFYEFHNEGTGN